MLIRHFSVRMGVQLISCVWCTAQGRHWRSQSCSGRASLEHERESGTDGCTWSCSKRCNVVAVIVILTRHNNTPSGCLCASQSCSHRCVLTCDINKGNFLWIYAVAISCQAYYKWGNQVKCCFVLSFGCKMLKFVKRYCFQILTYLVEFSCKYCSGEFQYFIVWQSQMSLLGNTHILMAGRTFAWRCAHFHAE